MGFLKSIAKRKLFLLALIYLALLVWSAIYRSQIPDPLLPNTKSYVTVNAVDSERHLDRKIRFAYQDTGIDQAQKGDPVILVHGSPGSSDAFDGLTKLIQNRRVISVDLPGFGDSEARIPDYSILAHSRYLTALMNELKIEKAHFVGFSLGGGVILHLYDEASERVESVSFIASIGVQEYELLGNFYANRIVHSAQLAFFWLLQNLTPHFGAFDGMMMSYARNFYDTDQRPLRQILENFEKPFQIIHGKDDPLVPVEAAREHARIVPQSEYHELEDNHFFVFMRPETINEKLQTFWTRVESGDAKTRAIADPARIAESEKPFEPKPLKAKGATVFVFFLLIVFLTFVHEDFAFLIVGFLAGQGWFGLEFAIVVSIFGALLSVFVLLTTGRFVGEKILDNPDSSVNFLQALKRKTFAFQFLKYFRAGRTRRRFWTQLFWFSLSAFIWAIGLNSLSYLLTKLIY